MDDVELLERERRNLLALAYRMLGTVTDAEDAVQGTYVRWYRLAGAERTAVRNPAAWLTRVAGRVCLDMLGSARARRERFVGEWLPEPVPGESPIAASVPLDPLDRVARFLLGLPHLLPEAQVAPTVTADGLAFLITVDGRADAVLSLAVAGQRVTDVYIVRNPDKLTLWRE